MKEKARILAAGGSGSGSLVAAMIDARFDVTEDESELLSGDREEFYRHSAAKITPAIILPENNNFIQQKMQGKRRVY